MQNVLTPAPPHQASPGQWVTDLPGAPAGLHLQLHTVAPGHAAAWHSTEGGALLVLIDGLGKAGFDGAAQRVAAPCVVRQLAGAVLRITNQGSTPMRVMRWAPVAHQPSDDTADTTELRPQPEA
jgi:hypothetical protein